MTGDATIDAAVGRTAFGIGAVMTWLRTAALIPQIVRQRHTAHSRDLRGGAFTSPLEQPHDGRLCQRIEMQVEANDGSRGVRLHIQLVGFHREDCEQITMRMIALGRTRPAVARRTEVGSRL
jgi:hypothetical protein